MDGQSALALAGQRLACPSKTSDAKAAKSGFAGECCDNIRQIFTGQGDLPGVLDGFCIKHSAYHSELADPPATSVIRKAMMTLGDYTELLVLAEGRNIDEARGQLKTIAANLGVPLQALGVGGAQILVGGGLEALNPLIKKAAEASNSRELERVLRDDYRLVEAVVAEMKTTAKELFAVVVEAPTARLENAVGKNAELIRVETARIEAYRVSVSNYAALLDQYQSLLRELVASYDNQRNQATLASLAQRSAEPARKLKSGGARSPVCAPTCGNKR